MKKRESPEIIKQYYNLKKLLKETPINSKAFQEIHLKIKILHAQLKDYNYSFGQVIFDLRIKKGLNQYEAAELLQMSQQQLSQYENGYKKPGEDQIKRFAAAYNVSFVFSGESVRVI